MQRSRTPSPVLSDQPSETSGVSYPKSTAAVAGSIDLKSAPSPYSSPPGSVQGSIHEDALWEFEEVEDDVTLLHDVDNSLHSLKQTLLQHFVNTKRKIQLRASQHFKAQRAHHEQQVSTLYADLDDCKNSLYEYKVDTERSQQIAARACVLLGRRATQSKEESFLRLILTSWRALSARSSRLLNAVDVLTVHADNTFMRSILTKWRRLAMENSREEFISRLKRDFSEETQILQSHYEEEISHLTSEVSSLKQLLEESKRDRNEAESSFREAMLRGMSAFQKELSTEMTSSGSRTRQLTSMTSTGPFVNHGGQLPPQPEAQPEPPKSTIGLDSIESGITHCTGQVAVVSEKPRRRVVSGKKEQFVSIPPVKKDSCRKIKK
ncbi:hypothetical protein P9112_011398 [Eukaryota sp. TZLM1-RC]